MRTLFAASVMATPVAASTAFAEERPSSPPLKGAEGPDARMTQGAPSTQPTKGLEGPGIR